MRANQLSKASFCILYTLCFSLTFTGHGKAMQMQKIREQNVYRTESEENTDKENEINQEIREQNVYRTESEVNTDKENEINQEIREQNVYRTESEENTDKENEINQEIREQNVYRTESEVNTDKEKELVIRPKRADKDRNSIEDAETIYTRHQNKFKDIWMNMMLASDFMQGDNESDFYEGYENDNDEYPGDSDEEFHGDDDDDDDDPDENVPQTRMIQKIIPDAKEDTLKQPKKTRNDCECGTYNVDKMRIVNGKEAQAHQYPWMVSIQFRKGDFPFCGGSIISDLYVLTAAHCTDGLDASLIQVRIGDHDLARKDASRERSIPVKKIIQHEEFDMATVNHDIALLQLSEELEFTWRVNPICLNPPDLTFYNELVTVMGWGKVNSKHELGSPVLRYTNVRLKPMTTCRHNFHFDPKSVTSRMMCASGGDVITDACQGDSGGPLVWRYPQKDRYFIIGITSWGIGCALPEYPGIYTKLVKYLDWIYENTSDSKYCSTHSVKPEKKKKKGVPISTKKKKGKDKDKNNNKGGNKKSKDKTNDKGGNKINKDKTNNKGGNNKNKDRSNDKVGNKKNKDRSNNKVGNNNRKGNKKYKYENYDKKDKNDNDDHEGNKKNIDNNNEEGYNGNKDKGDDNGMTNTKDKRGKNKDKGNKRRENKDRGKITTNSEDKNGIKVKPKNNARTKINSKNNNKNNSSRNNNKDKNRIKVKPKNNARTKINNKNNNKNSSSRKNKGEKQRSKLDKGRKGNRINEKRKNSKSSDKREKGNNNKVAEGKNQRQKIRQKISKKIKQRLKQQQSL